MKGERFQPEDCPMLPHSEPESYPDDWEQIKPKTLLPQALTGLSAKNDAVKCRKTVQRPSENSLRMSQGKNSLVAKTQTAVNRQQVLDRVVSKSRERHSI